MPNAPYTVVADNADRRPGGEAGAVTRRIDADWLIVDASRYPDGARVDVRLRGGRIESVTPTGGSADAPPEQRIDARGGLLLPGLHDHHLHLFALAAAHASIDLSDAPVRAVGGLGAALRRQDVGHQPRAGAWLRGFGYHEHTAGALDRARLDALAPDRPVRIQHASGKIWYLNSQALAHLDLSTAPAGLERDANGEPTGRLFRGDDWLRAQLPAAAVPDLTALSRLLASFGLTGITDASAGNDPHQHSAFSAAQADGALLQSVRVMGGASLDPSRDSFRDAPRDSSCGAPSAVTAVHVVIGERKFLLDEDDLPPVDDLVRAVQAARAQGRGTAWHCVSRAELVYALHVLDMAGPARPGCRDRIEHGGVVPPEYLPLLAARRLTVVTQPAFIAERGDRYRLEADPDDLPSLYRLASLARAGVPLALSSDAPYGTVDPWAVMRAAVTRSTELGVLMGADEALSAEAALAGYLGSPEDPGGLARSIRPGVSADLCLLHAPWSEVRGSLGADAVRAVFRTGVLVHGA